MAGSPVTREEVTNVRGLAVGAIRRGTLKTAWTRKTRAADNMRFRDKLS